MKIGLKLYSTDVVLIPDTRELKVKEVFDFVELYVIPGSYENTIENWKGLVVPYVIHAPHSYHGINFAQADKWETNFRNFNEVRMYADKLGSDKIIIHGGNNGSLEELIRQVGLLNDKRIVLENKPMKGISHELCIGWSPREFDRFFSSGTLNGMALDFGHAACAAQSLSIDVIKMIKEFMVFNPKIYHLSDGDLLSERDIHLNLGKGNFNLAEFVSIIPEGSLITIESPRNTSTGLEDFINDVRFFREVFIQNKFY